MRLKKIYIHLLCICWIARLSAQSLSFDTIEDALGDPLFPSIHQAPLLSAFPYNPLVPPQLWSELEPYFLPDKHPIKSRLDWLFKHIRATQSEENFEKAGFDKPRMRKPTNIVIGRHSRFKDYIFKVYLDTQPPLCEWDNWVKRIEGARAIQACLDRHGFCHFSVPKKWIYPLPLDPSPPESPHFHRKNFILIVEKMDILPSKSNLKAFKEKITSEILQELYTILTDEGLIDSVYPDNIPFTTCGKLAFIDTEHRYPGRAVHYEKLTPFFSQKMQEYWQFLTERKSSP